MEVWLMEVSLRNLGEYWLKNIQKLVGDTRSV